MARGTAQARSPSLARRRCCRRREGMADALDMSLDDLISKSRSTHQRPRGRRRRPRPRTHGTAMPLQHPCCGSTLPPPRSLLSFKELFSDVGHIKRYSINCDRSRRSKGTAEVIFSRRSDALAAVKRYNKCAA
uniref:RRM domain-containing protein n=1 Tax=Sorghum bicolor TaxID=4558 RepID=C6JS84_SORBI